MVSGVTLDEIRDTRLARFDFDDYTLNNLNLERDCFLCYLDEFMRLIPGKDNYGASLTDDSFGITADDPEHPGTPVNTGFYHRVYQSSSKDPMGQVERFRGFNDQNVYMAQNSQEKIPSQKVTDCKNGVCTDYEQRWSWAIPLEIIYLTPLPNWNPYNLTDCSAEGCEDDVTANGRNGSLTREAAYNGFRDDLFYKTPTELFDSDERLGTTADTTQGVVGVLDKTGVVREVMASGTRILLPQIGAGPICTRYPIFPLHYDGSNIYKELEALKDVALRMNTYLHMYQELPYSGSGGGNSSPSVTSFITAETTKDPPGQHAHMLDIPSDDVVDMMTNGATYTVETELANGHSHTLDIRYDASASQPWIIASCDSRAKCWDAHPLYIIQNWGQNQ